mmetsp:Transcript_54467/g.94724  ORF Transcript_54467/g.94724 Transcript_54467/m.94724 type:complete len:541 (+) Transcript_54467:122-1744(+)
MDVSLTENPDGCPSFEPNPFKTQKCKNCGRLWTEHLGVITEAQIATYRKSLQKAADDKSAKEAEAKAKAKAKATAKKKAQQAVEDEWLFDGGASTEDQKTIALDDSDDDMGFRMYLGSEVGSAPVDSRQARPSETAKTLKVVNLIDFGECDVPEEIEASSSSTSFNMISPPAPAVAPPPVSMPTPAAPSSSETASAAVVKPPPPPGRSGRSASPGAHLKSGLGAGMRDHEEALLAEIEHLRQQLDDAAQERQIQVEMIKDDVLEKQKQVEELSQKNSDMEAALKSAKQEALELKQGLTAAQEEAVNRETEIQTLRIQAAELKEKLEVAEAQAASQPQAAQDAQTAEQQAAEAERVEEAELERQAQQQQAEPAETQRLQGEDDGAADTIEDGAAERTDELQTQGREDRRLHLLCERIDKTMTENGGVNKKWSNDQVKELWDALQDCSAAMFHYSIYLNRKSEEAIDANKEYSRLFLDSKQKIEYMESPPLVQSLEKDRVTAVGEITKEALKLASGEGVLQGGDDDPSGWPVLAESQPESGT